MIEELKIIGKSAYNAKESFKIRNKSFLFPLVILFLTILMAFIPAFSTSTLEQENLLKKFPGINAPIEYLLTSDIDCRIEDDKLVCPESSSIETIKVSSEESGSVTYSIYFNSDVANLPSDISVELKNKVTDNIIIFLETSFKIRYVEKNLVTGNITTYEMSGNYKKLNGTNFKSIFQEIETDSTLLSNKVSSFVYSCYLATITETNPWSLLPSTAFAIVLLIAVMAFITRAPTLFRRKKGFTFVESTKIVLTLSFSPLIIASISTLFGLSFASIFGLLLFIRVFYVYFRYILSKKNNIFKDLYLETKEERFNF